MHEDRSATSELEEKEHPSAGRERYDPRPLGLALAIYLIAQAGVLFFAVSPGADSSRFIAFAERLRSEAFFDVLRSEEDHPGYPLFLYGIFSVARWMGIDSASHLLLLAELASVAAGTLILILIHRTLASLSGPRAAAAATFSLALLPRPLWIFADVLSDPLHALFWVAGACAALVGLRDCRVRPFVVAGLFGALAYAIRPEALTLLATILCALVMVALHPESRRAWGMGRLVSAGGAVAGLFAVALLGFLILYGNPTPKPSLRRFLDALHETGLAPGAQVGSVTLAAIYHTARPALGRAFFDSLSQLGQLVQFFHAATFILAGLLALRPRSPRPSGTAFFLCAFVVQVSAVALVGREVLYVDARYFLPVLPFFVAFGATAVPQLAACFTRWVPALPLERVLAALLVAASLAFSLPSLLGRRLHEGRHGLMEAGRWLAGNIEPRATIYDPYHMPTWLNDLADRHVDETVPGTASLETPHYIVIQELDLDRTDAIIPRFRAVRRAMESASCELVQSFPRLENDATRTVHVLRFTKRPE